MPTFFRTTRFNRDYSKMTPALQKKFAEVIARDFIPALASDTQPPPFPRGLKVKRVQATSNVWELRFADDGRATFEYGDELQPGEPHVIWRRIGSHAIFGDP